jgi:hypothetical protein
MDACRHEGALGALGQQPDQAVVRPDGEDVEEVRAQRRAAQLLQRGRQAGRVGRRGRAQPHGPVAPDIVAPEGQRGLLAGRDGHRLVEGGVALHVGAAGRDAAAHGARAAMHRRCDVGRQHGVGPDHPARAALEVAVDQPLGAAGRQLRGRRGAGRRSGCGRGRAGRRRRAGGCRGGCWRGRGRGVRQEEDAVGAMQPQAAGALGQQPVHPLLIPGVANSLVPARAVVPALVQPGRRAQIEPAGIVQAADDLEQTVDRAAIFVEHILQPGREALPGAPP